MTRRKRRQTRPYRQRLVTTIMPADGVFTFVARARREGLADKGGLRVTVPRPVVRGLQHLGWAGFTLLVRINRGEAHVARARHPSDFQSVLPLLREHRGAVAAGDQVELEVTLVRPG